MRNVQVGRAHHRQRRPERDDGRPEITITVEEREVNDAAVAALAAEPNIYQRGGVLVRVVRDDRPQARGISRPAMPRIDSLPQASLREILAGAARWVAVRETKDGPQESAARPPGWCVGAVYARGAWPGLRHLEAVVDYPILRSDGTVLSVPGYDPATGLLLEPPAGVSLQIPARPTRDDAVRCRDELLDVVSDFPFERPEHKAAWLAALLTPLARFAFAGPAPLFLVDANTRGAGKGLLLDCIARIVTGERFTVATYTQDEDELRKRITALAMQGDRLVLFDNLSGKFGNATLDAALTATSWQDRVLGSNRTVVAPLHIVWFATGNNVAIGTDTARRSCHIRLETDRERPEERQDFRRPNLLAWVGEHRGRLLGAALTILRAYFVAGRPDQALPAWGSFEGWSRLVRSAVVWLEMPDPAATRLLLQETADVAAGAMAVLLECWQRMDLGGRGLTAAEVICRLYKEPPTPEPAWHAEMRDAVETLVGKADARSLGNKLRAYRRRVFGDLFFDIGSTVKRAARWVVRHRSEFNTRAPINGAAPGEGESGESGESFSPVGHGADADEAAWNVS